ncbi:MAG: Rieske (2Fe-2S) protein [Haloarculaceae archaeon]
MSGEDAAADHVTTLDDLREGPQRVTHDGRTFLVVETDDGVVAYRNVCPHQYGPIAEGRVEDGRVICPWHGWEYDLETGENPFARDALARSVPQAPVVVEDGRVFIDL